MDDPLLRALPPKPTKVSRVPTKQPNHESEMCNYIYTYVGGTSPVSNYGKEWHSAQDSPGKPPARPPIPPTPETFELRDRRARVPVPRQPERGATVDDSPGWTSSAPEGHSVVPGEHVWNRISAETCSPLPMIETMGRAYEPTPVPWPESNSMIGFQPRSSSKARSNKTWRSPRPGGMLVFTTTIESVPRHGSRQLTTSASA